MKKIYKYALGVTSVLTLAAFGAYRTYVPSDVLVSDQDLMVAENVLALTEFKNPVENGTVDVRVYNRPCYFDVVDGTRKVLDPGHLYSDKGYYTEYHHSTQVRYYQVCVLKSYEVAHKWGLCDRSKAVGCSWCTSQGGSTQKPEIPDAGEWRP